MHITPYPKCKHRDNVAVELEKLLGKFYAEIKKQDGENYEPELLKIMQCALERYLKENGYEIKQRAALSVRHKLPEITSSVVHKSSNGPK